MKNNQHDITVGEFLFSKCSRSVLTELAKGGGEYWKGVENFVDKNEHERVRTLSFKESMWLIKIKGDLLHESKRLWNGVRKI